MTEVVEMPSMAIMTVAEMTDRINAIQTVTRNKMIADVHYGVIPGTKKPTLYKAGSEMLLTMFQVGPEVTVLDLSTPERIKYRVTVTGIHTPSGRAIGQGVGECSSSEEKYKWRNAICDEEFDATPDGQRRIKWGRGQGGSIYQTKQIRTVPDDLGNTVLKMAKKRAQIDMTLTALGVSDLFNQDIEDLPPELRQGAADERDGAPAATMGASHVEHPGMKAAASVQELAKIMSGLKQDEKKKYVGYFNQRMQDLKGGTK
jgi:hypothetical protein